MTRVQKQFLQFNDKIHLEYDTSKELREKREIIIRKLNDCDELPRFSYFNQGSYAMYTGVKPIDKEYDIDVGVEFFVSKKKYDPLKISAWYKRCWQITRILVLRSSAPV